MEACMAVAVSVGLFVWVKVGASGCVTVIVAVGLCWFFSSGIPQIPAMVSKITTGRPIKIAVFNLGLPGVAELLLTAGAALVFGGTLRRVLRDLSASVASTNNREVDR